MPEYGPRPVIEPPGFVQRDLERRQHLLDAACEVRIARRRILHLIELTWKSTEIVNRLWSRGNSDASFWNKPMRRDRQNCLGSGSLDPNPPPRLGVAIVPEGIHWIAMAEKDGRQHCPFLSCRY